MIFMSQVQSTSSWHVLSIYFGFWPVGIPVGEFRVGSWEVGAIWFCQPLASGIPGDENDLSE
jgi:hypothetical protein